MRRLQKPERNAWTEILRHRTQAKHPGMVYKVDAEGEIALTWDWLSQDERDMVLSTMYDFEMWEIKFALYMRIEELLFMNEGYGGLH